jgi:hypothetical protein
MHPYFASTSLFDIWACGKKSYRQHRNNKSQKEKRIMQFAVFLVATTAFIRETSLFGPELRPHKRSRVSVSHTKSSSSPAINWPNWHRPPETGQMHKAGKCHMETKNMCGDIE